MVLILVCRTLYCRAFYNASAVVHIIFLLSIFGLPVFHPFPVSASGSFSLMPILDFDYVYSILSHSVTVVNALKMKCCSIYSRHIFFDTGTVVGNGPPAPNSFNHVDNKMGEVIFCHIRFIFIILCSFCFPEKAAHFMNL